MRMSFTSLEFLFFFTACLCLIRLAPNVLVQKWWLIAFSYLFYISFGVAGVIVVTLTAGADFWVGRQIDFCRSASSKRRWLWLGVGVNLGLLVCVKYVAFFVGALSAIMRPFGMDVSVSDNPRWSVVGLSYFVFCGLSYVMDVYYERIEGSESGLDSLSYLVYFPKLVAGPIVRATELLPQLKKGVQFRAGDFETGCAYFLVGAVKKLVIADQLAGHVGLIFAAPQRYGAFTLVQGILGYGVQVYLDFSGYSDMAIGCARVMGLRFPQNFLMPYGSVNIAEFWRRWHVTMSTWFRDYLFLPLEMASRGIRNANVRVARNTIITMLLCGLWHGAGWNFVLWGGLHGVALAVYQVYASRRLGRRGRARRSWVDCRVLGARALTLSVVALGWVLFGSSSVTIAFIYLWRVLTWASDGVELGSPYILPLAALVFVAHLFIDKDHNLIEDVPTYPALVRIVAYGGLLLALTSLAASEVVPFVYVQF